MSVSILRVIFGLAFILFIPGFVMTWTFYITKDQIPVINRFALSFILSLAIVMLSTLFLDYVIGVDTTPVNIMVTLIIITILTAMIWKIRSLYSARATNFQNNLSRILKNTPYWWKKP